MVLWDNWRTLHCATGVPIDRYSFESVELLRDIIARLIASVGEMAGQADIGPQEMTAALREKLKKMERLLRDTQKK